MAEPIEMPFGVGLLMWAQRTMYEMGLRSLYGNGKFLGFPAHRKALGVSAVVYAAKGIIQSSIQTARYAMRCLVE